MSSSSVNVHATASPQKTATLRQSHRFSFATTNHGDCCDKRTTSTTMQPHPQRRHHTTNITPDVDTASNEHSNEHSKSERKQQRRTTNDERQRQRRRRRLLYRLALILIILASIVVGSVPRYILFWNIIFNPWSLLHTVNTTLVSTGLCGTALNVVFAHSA